ncbi:unnamed protein product [Colias eurytheme]|nr:unnamed protein product [Colias eurytheme]
MPPRCHRKKCGRKYPHAFVSSPRPCVDSLHLPLDFYLPHHMFYPPPYYHAPFIRHEYICECPESPTVSGHSSIDYMAANHNRPADKHKICPGNCTPPEVTDPQHDQLVHNDNRAQRHAQVPYTPSTYNEQPPQYPNNPETSVRNDRQRYVEKTDQQHINFEEEESVSYPHGTYQQMTRAQERTGYKEQIDSYPRREKEVPIGERNATYTTLESDPGTHNPQRPLTKNPDTNTFHQSVNPSSQQIDSPGHHNFQGPPPQYTDTLDVSLPHYSLPPSSCCKNSRFSDSQRTINSERTPSPQNNSGFRRYQDSTPDPIRRFQDSTIAPRYPMASDSNPPPCCAKAFNQRKDNKPPLSKGMSGAHRPGFVFNENTDHTHDLSAKGCMSNGSGCTHGITSIMPNATQIQEKLPQLEEKTSTCSCKESKKIQKGGPKSKEKKEAGTDVSHSASNLRNKRFCSCRYPPAFGQFSCSGNITGSCMCNEQNFQ